MIEKMKKVTVFSQAKYKEELLISLRNLGLLHISNLVEKTEKIERMESKAESYKTMVRIIEETVGKKEKALEKDLNDEEFEKLDKSLRTAISERERLEREIHELNVEKERIEPFGVFYPDEVEHLREEGVELYFYTLVKKELEKLEKDPEVPYLRISYKGKLFAVATVGQMLPPSIPAALFKMPKLSLDQIEAKLSLDLAKKDEINSQIKNAAAFIGEYKKRIFREEEEIVYEKASATVESEDKIIYMSGYVPREKESLFTDYCKKENVGYAIEDPTDDDNPPTEVKNRGIIKIIKPVFDMLGLVPGYREHDISLWFLVFLTLFFAMILGDGGYGLIFVIIAIVMNIKSKKCTRINSLIYLFGGATVIWGALTGTWFGSYWILEKARFLQLFVIPEITNFPEIMGVDSQYAQDMLMKVCFCIGTIHISLACAINIVTKIPKKDLSFIADIGWLIDTVLLYLLVLYLVIGESAPMMLIVYGVATGFILVCFFGSMSPSLTFVQGLKASLGGFFTTFLNTISCFSNIMSYIRLFAVGMASLAIAESFNDMAAPMLHGFALPAAILILVVGHVINLVMGLLSVVVHGVRLNVLEFSNQLGMEWSGYKYEPFRKRLYN